MSRSCLASDQTASRTLSPWSEERQADRQTDRQTQTNRQTEIERQAQTVISLSW